MAGRQTETNCLRAESAVALILVEPSLWQEERNALNKALDTIRDVRKRAAT